LCLSCLSAACTASGDILAPPPVDPGNEFPSNLAVTASIPASGDGVLTEAATLEIDSGGTGYDALTLSQTVGDTHHEVVVTWDTATQAVRGVSHVWGPGEDHGSPTSGFTACFAGINDCDPARVTIDVPGKVVALDALQIGDVFGGTATSTLDGTIGW